MKSSMMTGYRDEKRSTSDAKTYNLYLPWAVKIILLIPLGIFAILAILFLVFGSLKGGPPKFVGIFFLGWVAWFCYFISSIPYKINAYGASEIEFISLTRNRRVSPVDIISIKPYGSQFGFLLVKTNRGKIKLINQFDGFHEFIAKLKVANPSIELRGC